MTLTLISKSQMDDFSSEIEIVEVKTISNDIQNHFSWAENMVVVLCSSKKLKVALDVDDLETITRNLANKTIKVLKEKVEKNIFEILDKMKNTIL